MYCPHCHSLFTKKLSLIWDEQTHTSVSRGVFHSGRQFGIYKHRNVIQSHLARKVAPPAPPKLYICLIVKVCFGLTVITLVVAWMLSAFLPELRDFLQLFTLLLMGYFWIWGGVQLFKNWRNFPRCQTFYQKQLVKWYHCSLCLSCGKVFQSSRYKVSQLE